MSVSQIRPGLYLCGLDSALNAGVLSSRKVTLVVNASGLEDLSYPQLDGLQVLHIPIQDQPHAPLGQYFDLVAERINQNHTGTTLVHCSTGRSRSPTLIMAFLMKFEGHSLRQAYELVLEQRPFIRPNAGFWRQLIDYETTRTVRTTVRMAKTSSGVLPEVLEDSEDSNSAAAYCINA
ncbi:dual specificity protein phosphatase 14-like isoform X2 [Xyrichtys novacula]|uniref:Dual specificity protein phosphatase 14-like isoform X2 n=1 Tax=Xyrichtys novacula TaxID=13765 RepID=A0AAV1FXJ6_XYRNO|nr:dual specificity protein phosphatase 14-like isoform X2 [Xyrichtys novacula]